MKKIGLRDLLSQGARVLYEYGARTRNPVLDYHSSCPYVAI